jgi:hypothetical protein
MDTPLELDNYVIAMYDSDSASSAFQFKNQDTISTFSDSILLMAVLCSFFYALFTKLMLRHD